MRRTNTLLTHADHRRLRSLVDRRLATKKDDLASAAALRQRLSSARVVSPNQIPRNVVTMNSRVILRNLDSGDQVMCRLAYPHEARQSPRNVCVSRPLGTAILGKRVGQVIRWPSGQRERRMRIQQVLYQPESAGERHL